MVLGASARNDLEISEVPQVLCTGRSTVGRR